MVRARGGHRPHAGRSHDHGGHRCSEPLAPGRPGNRRGLCDDAPARSSCIAD